MAVIALFHSVLGIREGVKDAARRLSGAGHSVHVVDQYDGKVFDDYREASDFAEGIGYPTLMAAAVEAVAELDDGFIAMGFSNGGGMSEAVATVRTVSGVIMLSGALPLDVIGVDEWPTGVPAQIHYTVDDYYRKQESIDQVAGSIRAAGGVVEVFDYPGSGHLFTDRSLPDEYDGEQAELLWKRVLQFCDQAA